MKLELNKRSKKALDSMDRTAKRRIKAALDALPAGDVLPLVGYKGHYRLRVGDWRVIFTYPAEDVVLIERIAPRGEVYKGV